MDGERRFRSPSAEATVELARQLGRRLGPGAVVALDGELGAGKTTFARGLAQGLDVEEAVTSPTYTLMHEYEGRLPVHHYDAWMEGRERAFLDAGGAEGLHGDGVALVEWAERVAAWLPTPRLEVRLEHVGPDERRLTLRPLTGPQPSARARALVDAVGALPAAGPAEAPWVEEPSS